MLAASVTMPQIRHADRSLLTGHWCEDLELCLLSTSPASTCATRVAMRSVLCTMSQHHTLDDCTGRLPAPPPP